MIVIKNKDTATAPLLWGTVSIAIDSEYEISKELVKATNYIGASAGEVLALVAAIQVGTAEVLINGIAVENPSLLMKQLVSNPIETVLINEDDSDFSKLLSDKDGNAFEVAEEVEYQAPHGAVSGTSNSSRINFQYWSLLSDAYQLGWCCDYKREGSLSGVILTDLYNSTNGLRLIKVWFSGSYLYVETSDNNTYRKRSRAALTNDVLVPDGKKTTVFAGFDFSSDPSSSHFIEINGVRVDTVVVYNEADMVRGGVFSINSRFAYIPRGEFSECYISKSAGRQTTQSLIANPQHVDNFTAESINVRIVLTDGAYRIDNGEVPAQKKGLYLPQSSTSAVTNADSEEFPDSETQYDVNRELSAGMTSIATAITSIGEAKVDKVDAMPFEFDTVVGGVAEWNFDSIPVGQNTAAGKAYVDSGEFGIDYILDDGTDVTTGLGEWDTLIGSSATVVVVIGGVSYTMINANANYNPNGVYPSFRIIGTWSGTAPQVGISGVEGHIPHLTQYLVDNGHIPSVVSNVEPSEGDTLSWDSSEEVFKPSTPSVPEAGAKNTAQYVFGDADYLSGGWMPPYGIRKAAGSTIGYTYIRKSGNIVGIGFSSSDSWDSNSRSIELSTKNEGTVTLLNTNIYYESGYEEITPVAISAGDKVKLRVQGGNLTDVNIVLFIEES